MLDGAVQGLQGIFEILFIMAVGFGMARKGWVMAATSALWTKIVMKVALPLYMLCQMEKDFTQASLLQLAPDLALPLASMLLAYGLGRLAAKGLKIRRKRQGIFITCFFIANTIFIGLPVNLALFGSGSVPSVMLYYMVNTTLFWTVGMYHIVGDGLGAGGKMPLFSVMTLKKILSPPLLAFLAGLVLVLVDLHLPEFLLTSFLYVGNLATPMSLMVIGMEMSFLSLAEVHWGKDIIGALAGRFLVCPLCVLVLLPWIGVSPMSAKVFVMQAAMPAMTQMTVVAKVVGADVAYSTEVSFISIMLGMVVIPLYMMIV